MKEKTRFKTAREALLVGGILAGPLFLAIVALQIFTRAGFNYEHHPISLLSLGDSGWIQIVNFLLGGGLSVGLAFGIRGVLHPGPGGAGAPWSVGVFGLGVLLAGVFPPDPAFGFPPGTPDSVPAVQSYSSMLHGLGFTLSFLALTVACLVVTRRDAVTKQWAAALYSLATAVSSLALSMWPTPQGASLRYLVAALLVWTWISVLSARLLVEFRRLQK